MNIRQYGISTTRILILPRDARFLGASYGVHEVDMFFQHSQNWTLTESWNVIQLESEERVHDEYEFMGMVPPNGPQRPQFLYRIKPMRNAS